jgi:uncharacterized LabA/DUF88 family protein
MDEEPETATLVFRQQMDGRKVSRLPGGKVVLVDLADLDRVKDGEWWAVRLRHRDTFAIATPLERAAPPEVPVLETPQPPPPPPPPPSATKPAAPGPAPAPARHQRTALEVGGMLIEPTDVLRREDRVAFFIDGANMDGAARSAGFFLDFRRALDYFLGPATFYAGFYYVADFTASDSLQQRFLDALSYGGFIVRKKPVKVITDPETGERLFKGNLDTEIVLDMLNTVGNYDVAYLFSGDSDFERAIDLLRSRGKRVYVVSSRRTLARELAYIADKPVFFLEDFRSMVEKTDAPATSLSTSARDRPGSVVDSPSRP